MLLRRIEIENFRSYRAPTILDLKPPTDRNVYLIGGRTGSGKTTLFGALQLCLFGRFACDQFTISNPNDTLFEVWGADRFERSAERIWTHIADTGGYQTKIALTYADEKERYLRIERIWQYRLGRSYAGRAPVPRVDEQVLLFENNELLTGFSEDEIQRWIELEVPPTTSRFFFFDGEQIQRFADEEAESENLKQSIEILLGIDRFRQLREDIYQYVVRQIGDEPIESVEAEELNIRGDLKKIDGELARVTASIEELQVELRELSGRERKMKTELDSLLAAYDPQQQEQHDQLLAELERVQIELRQAEESARTMIQNNLAYQLLYEPLTMLVEAAEQDQLERQKKELVALLEKGVEKCAESLVQRGSCICGATFPPTAREAFQKELLSLLKPLITRPSSQVTFPLSGLITNPERIQRFIDEVTLRWEDLGSLCSRRQELVASLTRLDREVRSLTPDPDLQDRYAKLDAEKADVMGQQGRRRSDLEKLKRNCEEFELEHKNKERELETVAGRLLERRKQLDIKRQAETIAIMLNELIDRLRQTKLGELESFTTELYNRLQVKLSYRGKIRFKPDDFTSVIEVPSGQILRKGELSAGEKEIYAISLIGGLCRAANRTIPIIIDTPLSRLDRENRRNVVQHYYPKAGGQVILLSTDQEVYGQYYDDLRDFILQTFLLEYDEKSKTTCVRADAYF